MKKIENVLKKIEPGNINNLSSEFYTLIPHAFGRNIPPPINNIPLLQSKLAMLEALADIEIASSLMKQGDITENPIDSHYKNLHCSIAPLPKGTEIYNLLEKFVIQGHGPTHTTYTLEVMDIYQVYREVEEERYKKYSVLPNRMLLWHGSRLTNWVGILSQGLRIAPPEAPVTGYMFGKGVYFADICTKSANYCCTNRTNNTGVMLLCEVALGKTFDLFGAQYMDKPQAGTDSTKGVGKNAPDPAETVMLSDGVAVPIGKSVATGVTATTLLYNEFIVYDVAQLKIKYLFLMKFNYK